MTDKNNLNRFKEPCKECGHRGIPMAQNTVIFGDKNNPIKVELGEHLSIGQFKYKIVPSKQLCSRTYEPLCDIKRVE